MGSESNSVLRTCRAVLAGLVFGLIIAYWGVFSIALLLGSDPFHRGHWYEVFVVVLIVMVVGSIVTFLLLLRSRRHAQIETRLEAFTVIATLLWTVVALCVR